MPNDRRRILELALESLELKKKEIETEIAEIRSELQGRTATKKSPAPKAKKTMKEYWENWRKKNEGSKKA